MEIKLELFELKNICMEMAELGAAASEKRRSPASDKITQREARRWIKNMGYAPGFLDTLEEVGLVKKSICNAFTYLGYTLCFVGFDGL